jgi:hypothetical protein
MKIADMQARLAVQPGDHWRAGCLMAQCFRLAKKDPGLAEDYARRAIEHLRTALAQGYRNPTPILNDPELEPLCTRLDFHELAKQAPAAP